MTKNNKNTARYQLSIFLQSKKSFEFKLNGDDLAVLMTIFDFMDSGDNECCFAKHERLCELSRVPDRSFKRSIKKLKEFKIITSVRRKYNNDYFIGENIKYQDRPHWPISSSDRPKSTSRRAKSDIEIGQNGLSHIYNNNYNNNISKIDLKKSKDWTGLAKTSKKISPLLEEFIKGKK